MEPTTDKRVELADSTLPTFRPVALTLLVVLCVAYAWLFRDITAPNEHSRIYLAVAVVDHGSFSLDPVGERFGGVLDLAKFEGEYRCDKAPGASLLGAVVYGAARLVTEPDQWTSIQLLDLMRFWLMIPIGLLGFLWLRRLLDVLGVEPPVVDVVSLGWMLGTAAFHYSNAYFGHQIAATGLVGALLCVRLGERRVPLSEYGAARFYALAAGLLAGMAGMTEYPAGIACVLLALYVITGPMRRDLLGLLAFGLGAGVCLAALLWYHDTAFGGPLDLPYYHLTNQRFLDVHTSGLAGLKWPTWERFSGSMLSLHRGLLATSPMFLLVLPGLWAALRSGRRRIGLLLGATVLAYVGFISSWPLWEGGWGFGPRHLVVMMGWSSVLVAFGFESLRGGVFGEAVARGTVVAGIAYHQVVGAFFPEMAPETTNPAMDTVRVMIEEGHVGPNLVKSYTSLSGFVSVVPLALMVTLALWLVLTRGLYRGTQWWKRWLIVLLALLIPAAAGRYIYNRGTSWKGNDRAAFMKMLEHVRKAERGFEENS
ncbi:MAG: hypothetical protein ABEL76_00200 [Bradymonadaceae bacterium]